MTTLQSLDAESLHPNLVICPSKAFVTLFTKMRDVRTSCKDFTFYAKRAMRLLAEDTIAELPGNPCTISTPCCDSFEGTTIDTEKICAVSIIRSGDALLEAFCECLQGITCGKILIQRDESSEEKTANLYYSKLPSNVEQMNIILCDPMLATGSSAITAIQELVKHGVPTSNIIFANMITCPEGLKAMAKEYPEIKIVSACVDQCLNDDKYIVPGLGDYGDRFFNTI